MSETLNTCPECGQSFEGLEFRVDADGCTRGRDAAGAIRHAHLSKVAAQRMSAIGAKASSREGKAEAQALADALCDVLVDPDDPRGPALTLLLSSLARAASKDSQSSIKAVDSALALVGSRPKEGMRPPRAGETCGLCGRFDPLTLPAVSPEGVSFMAALIGGEIAKERDLVYCRKDPQTGALTEVEISETQRVRSPPARP